MGGNFKIELTVDVGESVYYDKVNDFQEEFYQMASKLRIKILHFKHLGSKDHSKDEQTEDEEAPIILKTKRRKRDNTNQKEIHHLNQLHLSEENTLSQVDIVSNHEGKEQYAIESLNLNINCPQCNASLSADSLRAHIWRFHSEKEVTTSRSVQYDKSSRSYPCRVCQEQLRSLYKIKEHYSISHEEEEFIKIGLDLNKLVSPIQRQSFKKQHQIQVHKEVVRWEKELGVTILQKVQSRMKSQFEEEFRFKLDKDKFKTLYQLFLEAEENSKFNVGKSDQPVIQTTNESRVILFPYKYFKRYKENQLTIDSQCELLKRARALEFNKLLPINRIIKSKSYIGFETELLDTNLSSLLQEQVLTPSEKCKIIISVFAGIQQMHTAEFIHGDITAESIFLNRDLETVKLSCFKQIRFREETAQEEVFIWAGIHKPPYKVNWERGSILWDIYSFGILAYHLLVGSESFHSIESAGVERAQSFLSKSSIAMRFTILPENQLLQLCLHPSDKNEDILIDKIKRVLSKCRFE